jgi:GTP-binding protein
MTAPPQQAPRKAADSRNKSFKTGGPPSQRAQPAAEHAAALAWTHTARFLTTASKLDQLPATELPEIAFVGRSNAGKSTAINRLAQQKRLAFASRTPGRTQHINLFELGPKDRADALFADLPGYGYAAVERAAKLRWQEVMAQYLAERSSLSGVVLMVDSRLGFTDLDRQLLQWVGERVGSGEVRLLVLLTKADKLNRREAQASLAAAQAVLAELATDEADIGVALFSALSKLGVDEAAQALRDWVQTPVVVAAPEATETAEPAEPTGPAESAPC